MPKIPGVGYHEDFVLFGQDFHILFFTAKIAGIQLKGSSALPASESDLLEIRVVLDLHECLAGSIAAVANGVQNEAYPRFVRLNVALSTALAYSMPLSSRRTSTFLCASGAAIAASLLPLRHKGSLLK